MMTPPPQRGFTLLIAVVLASVALSIGLILLDIALKQVILASSARQSQVAFYNADSALECALFFDQNQDYNTFAYGNSSGTVTCNGSATPITVTFNNTATPRVRSFTIPCSGGGTSGSVVITKLSDATTDIYATGYNICSENNPRRIERGLKVSY